MLGYLKKGRSALGGCNPLTARHVLAAAAAHLQPLLLIHDCCGSSARADWCAGVAATAAALPPDVALKQWRAPLLASHADDFQGEL